MSQDQLDHHINVDALAARSVPIDRTLGSEDRHYYNNNNLIQ